MIRLGIDLGGTKIEAALLDDLGNIVWRHRISSPQHHYPTTLEAIAELVSLADQAATHHGLPTPIPQIGIGIPGSVSPTTGLIRNANSTWLNGQRFQQDLELTLARPVRLANDANCLVLSEATDGAGQGASVVFGVILGTGVGGGLAINGELIVGRHAIAGEWGHNPLAGDPHDPSLASSCWCGRQGCLETMLSGPALVRAYGDPSRVSSVPDILVLQQAGDPKANEVMEVFYDRLARAFAAVINLIDPDCIVIGGGLSQIQDLYTQVPARWTRWVFHDGPVTTPLRAAHHGDASGVRGAAWLW
jgi:fructokinase